MAITLDQLMTTLPGTLKSSPTQYINLGADGSYVGDQSGPGLSLADRQAMYTMNYGALPAWQQFSSDKTGWGMDEFGAWNADLLNPDNLEALGYDEQGNFRVKLKTADKEGTTYVYAKQPDGTYKLQTEGTSAYWDTNQALLEDPMTLAMILGVTGIGIGAAGASAGLWADPLVAGAGGAAGAGTAAGAGGAGTAIGATQIINGIKYVWDGAKWVVGAIGTANAISNLTGNGNLIGPGGSIYNTSPGGGTTNPPPGGSTGTGGGTVTNPPGGTGGGGGTTTDGFDYNSLLNFILNAGGQAVSANRQENTADKLLAMYNDAKKQAEPWEEMLRKSYTEAGQKDLLGSPEFMSQQGLYKNMLDRNASKAGTLTNTMSGIPGIAPRGREAALQKFGLEYLSNWRKTPQEQVGLYTKNAADYKMLAALGLGLEANVPGQWAQQLQRYVGPGGLDLNKIVKDIGTTGGTLKGWWDWLTNPPGTNPDGNTTGGGPGGGGGDPAVDNPDWPKDEYGNPIPIGGNTGGTGGTGGSWDFSQQDQGVITDPDGNVWMPDPNTGDWSIVDMP